MFKKNLHLCFSRIRCLPTSFSQPLTLEEEEEEQQAYGAEQITKSFSSLYDLSTSNSHSLSTATTTAAAADISSSSEDYSDSEPHEPDFSTVFASQRFFVSSPGPSNSILDSGAVLVEGGVAVRKYSPDPHVDFRRSMEEMIRARREDHDRMDKNNGSSSSIACDWEYLHELLLCYLSLNPKQTHKYIIGAFTDLLVSLLSSPAGGGGAVAARRRIHGGDSGGILV